jgi:alkaline phosphatase D
MPSLSRAADRPVITHGVQSGDVTVDGGVIWARADRPSQMLVEVATTESFKDARALPPIAALPESVDRRRALRGCALLRSEQGAVPGF